MLLSLQPVTMQHRRRCASIFSTHRCMVGSKGPPTQAQNLTSPSPDRNIFFALFAVTCARARARARTHTHTHLCACSRLLFPITAVLNNCQPIVRQESQLCPHGMLPEPPPSTLHARVRTRTHMCSSHTALCPYLEVQAALCPYLKRPGDEAGPSS